MRPMSKLVFYGLCAIAIPVGDAIGKYMKKQAKREIEEMKRAMETETKLANLEMENERLKMSRTDATTYSVEHLADLIAQKQDLIEKEKEVREKEEKLHEAARKAKSFIEMTSKAKS
jgi:hypothetical protein